MCEPTTIMATTAAISAASTATSAIAKNQQAEAQAQHQQQVFQRNKERALEARTQKVFMENLRQQQEAQAASQRIQKTERQAAEARSRARVAAGESGVSGRSVDALLADFYQQEAEFRSAVQHNLQLSDRQSEARKDSLVTQQEGRVAAAQPQPVQRPNFLGAALQIGATGLRGAQQINKISGPSPDVSSPDNSFQGVAAAIPPGRR